MSGNSKKRELARYVKYKNKLHTAPVSNTKQVLQAKMRSKRINSDAAKLGSVISCIPKNSSEIFNVTKLPKTKSNAYTNANYSRPGLSVSTALLLSTVGGIVAMAELEKGQAIDSTILAFGLSSTTRKPSDKPTIDKLPFDGGRSRQSQNKCRKEQRSLFVLDSENKNPTLASSLALSKSEPRTPKLTPVPSKTVPDKANNKDILPDRQMRRKPWKKQQTVVELSRRVSANINAINEENQQDNVDSSNSLILTSESRSNFFNHPGKEVSHSDNTLTRETSTVNDMKISALSSIPTSTPLTEKLSLRSRRELSQMEQRLIYKFIPLYLAVLAGVIFITYWLIVCLVNTCRNRCCADSDTETEVNRVENGSQDITSNRVCGCCCEVDPKATKETNEEEEAPQDTTPRRVCGFWDSCCNDCCMTTPAPDPDQGELSNDGF